MKQLDVSVVIPTRDRHASLARTLNALAGQRFGASRFEVVVAVDGPEEETARYLAALDLPYPLAVVGSRETGGAAAARNRGAEAAQGELLIFLDDDIEAHPALVGAHVNAHHDGAHVTIGYLPPAFGEETKGFFLAALRGWWEAMFAAMRRPGHRYWFRDLLTGNCAVTARLFERLGRFDEDFRCHEDYEMGVRVIAERAVMRFVESASGTHHERTTLERAFNRKRDEGRADVLMLHKHPELAPSLPLGTFGDHATRGQRLLRRLAFDRPAAGRALASLLARTLPALEAGRFRGRWTRRVHALLSYWYWKGVVEAVGSWADFQRRLEGWTTRGARSPMMLEVDLANGLDLVMAQVDRRRPDGLRVMMKRVEVGVIAPVAGAEGLTGHHLKAALARELAGPLLEALGRTGVIPIAAGSQPMTATGPLPTETLRF